MLTVNLFTGLKPRPTATRTTNGTNSTDSDDNHSGTNWWRRSRRPCVSPTQFCECVDVIAHEPNTAEGPDGFKTNKREGTVLKRLPSVFKACSSSPYLVFFAIVFIAASIITVVASFDEREQVSVRKTETCPIIMSSDGDVNITNRACVMVAVGDDGVCSVYVGGRTREFRGVPCTHISDPGELQCVCWSDPAPEPVDGDCLAAAQTVSSSFNYPVSGATCDGGHLTVYITRDLDKRFDQVSVRSEAVLASNTLGEVAETATITFDSSGKPASVPTGLAWLTNATIVSVENVFCSEETRADSLCTSLDIFVRAVTTEVNSTQSCHTYSVVQRADNGEAPEELYEIYCPRG